MHPTQGRLTHSAAGNSPVSPRCLRLRCSTKKNDGRRKYFLATLCDYSLLLMDYRLRRSRGWRFPSSSSPNNKKQRTQSGRHDAAPPHKRVMPSAGQAGPYVRGFSKLRVRARLLLFPLLDGLLGPLRGCLSCLGILLFFQAPSHLFLQLSLRLRLGLFGASRQRRRV